MMANSLGELEYFEENPKQFVEYYKKSERFRRIMISLNMPLHSVI